MFCDCVPSNDSVVDADGCDRPNILTNFVDLIRELIQPVQYDLEGSTRIASDTVF